MIKQANGETAQQFTFDAENFAVGLFSSTAFALDSSPRLGELSCLYYDARAFDPQSGEFLSTEPIEHDTDNVYRHVAANPTNHVDPSGL